VIFTTERAPVVPNSPSSFSNYIRERTYKKIDDYTIRIASPDPYSLVPNELSGYHIVSKKYGEGATTADYNSGKAAIGTGPYKFAKYVPGDRIVYTRNESYWGGKPPFEKVILKFLKAGPSRVAALLSGEVDLIEDVPTPDVERLRRDARVTLVQGVSSRVIFLMMDQWRDVSPFIKGKDGSDIPNPLKDRRVRLALSEAINRDALVSRVMEGIALPAGQFLPDGYFGTSPKIKPAAYDPAGAKKLLAEAGYPNGFKITVHGPNGRYVNDMKILEAISQMWTRVGVETQFETMPPGVFFSRASQGAQGEPEFSVSLIGWSPPSAENSGALKPIVGTYDRDKGTGTSNFGRYSNAEVDRLSGEALATVDDGKRAEILARATETALEDQAVIPLHYQVNVWGLRKGLTMKARADEATMARSVSEE
jgi:peptide/nickel transport system substrate-binding protein